MSMICRIPASPAEEPRCLLQERPVRPRAVTCLRRTRQQPTDSVAVSGIVVLTAEASVVHPRRMRSARIDLRHREPGLHLILPPVVAWPSVSLYLVWRPGKGTITDRHGHRHRGPGQRRTPGSQQTPMRRGGGGWAAPTAREDTAGRPGQSRYPEPVVEDRRARPNDEPGDVEGSACGHGEDGRSPCGGCPLSAAARKVR